MKKKVDKVKKNGEVFTPPSLVIEMLDLIKPEMMKVDSTILDPASGATCIFPIFYLFKAVRLFGVENIKTISDNIYCVELDKVAYEYSIKIFEEYYQMILEKGVDFSQQHYIDNFEQIKNNYFKIENI